MRQIVRYITLYSIRRSTEKIHFENTTSIGMITLAINKNLRIHNSVFGYTVELMEPLENNFSFHLQNLH